MSGVRAISYVEGRLRVGIKQLVRRGGNEIVGAVRLSASAQTRSVESCCDCYKVSSNILVFSGREIQRTITSVRTTGTGFESRPVEAVDGGSKGRSRQSNNWEKLESDHCVFERVGRAKK